VLLAVAVVQSLSALKESDIGVLVVDVARLLDAPSSSTVSRGLHGCNMLLSISEAARKSERGLQ
jgi:hypothetical protein